MSNKPQTDKRMHDSADPKCEFHTTAARLKGVRALITRQCPHCSYYDRGGYPA